MRKLLIFLMQSVLWSVTFLPNGQYVVVNDGNTGSATVSNSGGGSYKTTYSDGSSDTLIPTGHNSYYQNTTPSYQAPSYQAPSYQAPSQAPDFRVKPNDFGYGQ